MLETSNWQNGLWRCFKFRSSFRNCQSQSHLLKISFISFLVLVLCTKYTRGF